MPRVSITIPGKNSQPYRFQLDRTKVTIGRSGDNDIIIDDPSVSGVHCTMERVDGGYILRDRKSTNGISLDDDDMDIIDLRNGDDVKVGDVQFEYTLTDEELDELDSEDFKSHERKKSEAKPQKPPLKKAAPAASPVTPQPMLTTSSSGSGMLGFFTCILGILTLILGINNSYVSKQEKQGRKGDFNIFTDIRDGKPPMPKNAEEKENE